MAFTKAVSMQENAKFPESLHLPLLSASKSIIRHESLKAPKDEVQSVTHEEVHYTSKELLKFSDSDREKSGDYV